MEILSVKLISMIDTKIMSIYILVFLIYMYSSRINDRVPHTKYLKEMMYINLWILCIECIINIFTMNLVTEKMVLLEYCAQVVYYILIAFFEATLLSCMYSFYKHDEVDKKMIRLFYALIMVYIISIVCINVVIGGKIFDVTLEDGIVLGKYAFLRYLVSFIYSIISFILICLTKTGEYIDRDTKYLVILQVASFVIPPFMTTFLFDLHLAGSAFALSIACIISIIIKEVSSIDSLTGAISRRAFNLFLNDLNNRTNKDYSIAFVDMDNLKKINDTYGHNEGDIALSKLVEMIKKVISQDDKIARFGGDEFVIYFQTKNRSIIDGKIQEINEYIRKYNEEAKKPYILSFSISYDTYDEAKYESAHELLKYVDNKMYEVKFRKKNLEHEVKMI